MAYSKKDKFSAQEAALADFSKVLGHPARLAILKKLAERNTCICGEIVDLLPLAQSTISQHLKALKNAGLIKGEIDGPKSCYCVDYETLQTLSNKFTLYLESLLKNSTKRKQC